MAHPTVGDCPLCGGDIEQEIGNPRAVGKTLYYTCEDCGESLERCDACDAFRANYVATRIEVPIHNHRDPEAGVESIITCPSCDPQSVQQFADERILSQTTFSP